MTTPHEMTAIAIEGGKGSADAVRPAKIPTPHPGPGQILIRVRAAGVNRPDLLQREGGYPPPPGAPDTMGLEVAGEVAAVGPGAGRWKVGDHVVALLGGGGYAEYAVVDARHALPIPKGLDLVQAAALPETVFTVFVNLFEHGALQSGETVLIHGATSGIGVAAIQVAKAAGAMVITTSRGADKAAEARRLGADIAVDTTAEDFLEVVREAGGADVILDMVGAAYAGKNIDALNAKGRLVVIAVLGGAKAEINLAKVMSKQLVITGSTLRPRSPDEKARVAAAVEARIWPWIEAGEVHAVIDKTYPLTAAADAHRHLETGSHVGKVVLVV